MTILQINIVANWGSTGRISEEMGLSIIASGNESYIAFGRKRAISQSHLFRIGNSLEMCLHVFMSRLFDRQGLGSISATKKMINEIKKISPDIIHLHNIHGYYLNYKILFDYLAKNNIPVVWTLHDCWSFTGHCSHFMSVRCERWKEGCHDCPLKRAYPTSWLLDRSRKNYADKKRAFTSLKKMIIVPVSDWLGSIVKQSFLQVYSMKRIHNGIDTTLFSPKVSDIRQKLGVVDKYVILGVASIWTKGKGIEDFKKLSELLYEDEVIILVGLSKKQLKELPKNIIGIQRTEDLIDLVSLYSGADVFFNPTWEDNFPTTNLEALSCGTPVITYRTGGSIEAVDAATGFVVEQGDLNASVNKMRYMKTVGKEKYEKACRERAVSCFDKKDKYAEYLELYNELLNNE